MLRKLTIFLLLISPVLIARQLVHIEVQKNQNPEELIVNYAHPIFYEDRFILAIEPDSWSPENEGQEILGNWNERSYYFILYPIRSSPLDYLSNYGEILIARNEYLIFQSPYEVLNDFEPFHQFKLVRLFDKALVRTSQERPTAPLMTVQFNSIIQQMVDSVNVDSIWQNISTLQAMERYTSNSQAIESSNYLKNYFIKLGYDSVYFHNWHSGWIPNVIAVKYGKQFPDEIYVAGSHYDVYTNGAPGADDNGSGTASVMEMARVISAANYKRTVKLIAFSGEEMGLLGSAAYASQAASSGENILGMINMDMIAYVAAGDPIDVDLLKNTASTDLANFYIGASQMYVPSLSIVNGYLTGGTSDHASFWNNGFQAIFPFEDSDHYSPYIHSSSDVLGTSANNQTLAELGTKATVASLASLAEIAEARITGYLYSSETLSPIENATIFFNGDSVQTNAQGFYITPPLTPDIYTVIFTASGFEPDTMIHSLQPYEVFAADAYLIPAGSLRPFVHLQNITIDDDSIGSSLGNGNGLIDAGETIEIFGNFANTGNLAASNVTATIDTSMGWINILQNSVTVDSIETGGTAPSNNAFVIEIDPGTPANSVVQLPLEISYQGYITNSSFEILVHNRGDVLIIEDDDGSSGITAYQAALDSLGIAYDTGNPDTPLEVMEEYDKMIWFCGNDYSSTLTTTDQQKLTSYLNGGGALFINGNDIGYDIHTDPFYSNYLKANYIGDGPYSITSTAFGMNSDPISGDFTGGIGINTNYVDQIIPTGGASQIFYYNYNSTDYGCGIKYGGSYKLVYLTFIFENITNPDNRKLLLGNILNWFAPVTNVKSETEAIVWKFSLSQNYPNPFNPVTHIRYGIAKPSPVKIEIFNILGQKVITLLDAKKPAGQYSIEFDGHNIASGVYLYRIQAGNFKDVKKMILMK